MPRDLTKTMQRSLSHLKASPVKGGKFAMPIPSHFRPAAPFVQVKDRIPYWNIAPQDKVVLVRGSKDVKGLAGVVERVERESNRVFITGPQFQVKKRQQNQYPGESLEPGYSGGDAAATYYTPRPIHVNNVRLQVEDGGEKYTVTRMRRSAVTWDRRYNRFHWDRYGLVPALATEGSKGWVKIPWPKQDVPETTPGTLDSTEVESLRSSWTPSLDSLSLLDKAAAPELAVSEVDLTGGYHSRANRTQRFNDKKAEEKKEGKKIMREAIKTRVNSKRLLQGEIELE